MATYEELDARLSVVAADASDAVADVVAVARGRSTGADRTPAEAIKVLDGWYLKHQATEAGARAAGVGPATVSLDRTMVYLLALADIHGVDLTEPERRKALLMAVLLGDEGASGEEQRRPGGVGADTDQDLARLQPGAARVGDHPNEPLSDAR